jgi:predicted amidophosphoribosyltransferase
MGMVFCRGCGKEIHETATMCPHCGYQYSEAIINGGKKNLWMAVVSFVMALLCFLNWFAINTWTQDMKVGLWFFSIVSITLSSVSLAQKHKGKILNYISIGASVLTALMLIGKM